MSFFGSKQLDNHEILMTIVFFLSNCFTWYRCHTFNLSACLHTHARAQCSAFPMFLIYILKSLVFDCVPLLLASGIGGQSFRIVSQDDNGEEPGIRTITMSNVSSSGGLPSSGPTIIQYAQGPDGQYFIPGNGSRDWTCVFHYFARTSDFDLQKICAVGRS